MLKQAQAGYNNAVPTCHTVTCSCSCKDAVCRGPKRIISYMIFIASRRNTTAPRFVVTTAVLVYSVDGTLTVPLRHPAKALAGMGIANTVIYA